MKPQQISLTLILSTLLITSLLNACTLSPTKPTSCNTWRTSKENGKVGYVDVWGREKIPAQFDDAEWFNDNCFAEVSKRFPDGSEKVAIIDSTGTLRTDWYESFFELDNGTWIAKKEEGAKEQEILLGMDLKPLSDWYQDIQTFDEGMLIVTKNKKSALANSQGKPISEFEFTGFELLKNKQFIGEYWAEGEHRRALLDSTGKTISDWYSDIDEPAEGRLKVQVKYDFYQKYGFINEQGELVIPAKYYEAGDFHGGLAEVTTQRFGKNIGFIDLDGKMVIDPIWSSMEQRYDDMYLLSKSDGKYFVGKDNRRIAGPFHRMNCAIRGGGFKITKGNGPFGLGIGKGTSCTRGLFFDGRIAVAKKQGNGYKWGYLNESAELIIPMKFQDAHDFSQGLAGVKENGKFGYIDTEGNWVIEPQFDYAEPFKGGKAKAKLDGKQITIDKTGKVLQEGE